VNATIDHFYELLSTFELPKTAKKYPDNSDRRIPEEIHGIESALKSGFAHNIESTKQTSEVNRSDVARMKKAAPDLPEREKTSGEVEASPRRIKSCVVG
jgi:hypothetical protein